MSSVIFTLKLLSLVYIQESSDSQLGEIPVMSDKHAIHMQYLDTKLEEDGPKFGKYIERSAAPPPNLIV